LVKNVLGTLYSYWPIVEITKIVAKPDSTEDGANVFGGQSPIMFLLIQRLNFPIPIMIKERKYVNISTMD
jgi:hypothetical protein